jgi:hypothetical protein
VTILFEADVVNTPFPESLLNATFGYPGHAPSLRPEDFQPDEVAQLSLDRERLILWLYFALQGNVAFWTQATEIGTAFLTKVWQILFDGTVRSGTDTALYTLHVATSRRDMNRRTELRVYKPTFFESIRVTDQIESYLPDPGAEWTLHARS